MSTRHGFGTRPMRLLAVRLIERRDPNDALVLGDAMMEQGIDGLITGRSRPVIWRTDSWTFSALTVATRDEAAVVARTQREHPRFRQQAAEIIYNVAGFARKPDAEKWNAIWTHWVTPWRGTVQAMQAQGILPATFRFRELVRRNAPSNDALLSNDLYLERTPRNRKRPIQAYLFDIRRYDRDNPRTRGVEFDGGG